MQRTTTHKKPRSCVRGLLLLSLTPAKATPLKVGFDYVAPLSGAGEEAPPAYIWSALDVLKVERVDPSLRQGYVQRHDAVFETFV